MKKVLFLFPPREKAPSNFYPRVIQEMEILSKKMDVDYIETISKRDLSKKEPLQFRILKFFLLLPKIIHATARTDAVFLYTSPTWYLFAPLAKVFGKKIITDHFTTYIYNYEFTNWFFKFIFKFLDSGIYKLFDAVITHNDSMKKLIRSSYDIDPSKVHCIYSSIEVDYFVPRKKNRVLLKKLNLPINKPVIVYHGLFHPLHGVDIILEAAKILKKGGRISYYRRKLKNVSENVISHSPVKYRDLNKYLPLGDIWVGAVGLGIQGYRAMSSSMILAMSMGLIVITGDWKENTNFLINGQNAFIVKRNNPNLLANTIRRVIKFRHKNQISKNARTTAVNFFSTKVMEEKINSILKSLDL